ncbi:MAG: hypothetical protein KME15_08570 [Drouetiella hepatica Uher 2000/2452]|uniref:Lipopolysaccharide assembly protein A domain-containing protein n=1 Tax=Drouetiella hepatica Uher 2000/2452 TaxID=904376 RepID=A0A951UMH5_9CYAN|nr:hypothetical protein [Drouetiella hepatica Uher 2000/2452]
MSAIRIVPVLLILGGLVMFALQNMSPALPLVILGTATQPLPLALWIGGAIASGAVTTLLISGLSGLGRSTRRAPNRPAANRFSSSSAPRNPFARAAGSAPGSPSRGASASTSTRLQDDWENRGQAKDEWDDWEEPQTARPSSFNDSSGSSSSSSFRNPQPEIRDRTDDDWRNWDGYEDSRRDDRRESPNPEPRVPRRTDFEVKRDPATRYQSGSVYSYGYNQPDNPDFEDIDSREDPRKEEAPGRPGVYDAEYRVITPPYRPDPEVAPAHQDDWEAVEEELADKPFDSDLDGSNLDRNQRDRRTP